MELAKAANEFVDYLKDSQCTVALTGAGVSTASGIPDFRGPNGLYKRLPNNIFELEFFKNNPAKYYELTFDLVHYFDEKQPGKTHKMLAKLEKEGYLEGVITQNIDGLHQKAGSSNVVELHGNTSRFVCMQCGKTYSKKHLIEILKKQNPPECSCGGLIKPDVVFFGEMLPMEALSQSEGMSLEADLFVALGSSLVVYPAAQYPLLAKRYGSRLVIVNRGETGLDSIADYKIDGDLEEFSQYVIDLLE
ncbi:MAG: SIR2 family NAD-dependent protein deacylase [Petrotogales bacterium]